MQETPWVHLKMRVPLSFKVYNQMCFIYHGMDYFV